MKTVIAYGLVFCISPILSIPIMILLFFITGPLLTQLGLGHSFISLRCALSGCLTSIGTVWISCLIFQFFGLIPNIWMIAIVGVGQLIGDLRTIDDPGPPQVPHFEYIRLVSHLVGIPLSGFIFL